MAWSRLSADPLEDTRLLTLVETTLPGLSADARAAYAHARLRVLQGQPLTPAQRARLRRLLRLVQRLTAAPPCLEVSDDDRRVDP